MGIIWIPYDSKKYLLYILFTILSRAFSPASSPSNITKISEQYLLNKAIWNKEKELPHAEIVISIPWLW